MVRITILACLLGSAAGSAWSDYLAGLHGSASAFDWVTACKKLGQTPSGYGMSSGGGKTTFKLTCDSNHIDVICQGSTCSSTYSPPASSSDTPPTGDYAKTVSSTCPTGGFTADQVQGFLDIHNKMRCAVGAPPVTWDADLECQAQATEDSIKAFSHSHSYDMDIPAGENLATGTEFAAAAWMWFTEYLQSGGDYSKFSHHTGHYTAMVWNSVTTIGCGVGPHDGGKGVIRCMYSGGSKAAAPNMQGGFSDNLNAWTGDDATFKGCAMTAAEVKAKAQLFTKWGILHPSGTEASNIGLSSMEDQPSLLTSSPIALISACAFIGAIAMVAIRVVLRRRRNTATTQDDEELLSSIEEADGGLE